MIVIGIILLIVGWLLGFSLLVTLGIIAIVVGLILSLLGMTGHAIGGRRTWY